MKNILLLGDCIANGGPADGDEFKIQYIKQHGMVDQAVINDAHTTWSRANQWCRAWPDTQVHNLARLGETYTGMRMQYHDAVTKRGITPDMVVITDHANSHYGHYIKHQGQFIWMQREIHYLTEPQHKYPQEPYEQFIRHSKWERDQGEHYYNTKAKKNYQSLLNYCEHQAIPYHVLRFRTWSTFVMPGAVDCTDLCDRAEKGNAKDMQDVGLAIAQRIGL